MLLAREGTIQNKLCELMQESCHLQALRMGLRDVTTRLLCDRRWRAFAEPVTAEEDPEYLELV